MAPSLRHKRRTNGRSGRTSSFTKAEVRKEIDVETLTPLEALTRLAELQKLVKG
ncbi:MAG: hypothetical protein KY468_21070 [Armatimonadetes bacterium]|nr:hypothetical protein [Armatimonadota bacterium]